MKTTSNIVLRLLGVLLLTAAVLKGWQLLTEPVANSDIWSYRPFLILTVEFELALGIWLLSGLFKKAAWLAALLCFLGFSAITLYKAVTGAASCGCFGSVHVNPWITLFAVDLPAVVALAVFRPGPMFLRDLCRLAREQESIRALAREFFSPLPSIPRFGATAALAIVVLGVSAPLLALNKPAVVTSAYEVLEPETWVGKRLPILDHIDIGDKLEKGTWLLLLYHHDCPDCIKAIAKYEQMARDLAGNEDFLRIALIEVPPYGLLPISETTPCALGRLPDTKEWFVTTPAAALISEGKVNSSWEGRAPDFDAIVRNLGGGQETAKNVSFKSRDYSRYTLQYVEGR